jgi:ribosome-associated toxin RatA of RatAB toxin-antitoxin module
VVDQATQRTTIMASPQRCFDVAVDFEHYPVWARDIRKARILSRDRDGRAVDVEYWVKAMGRSTTYTLRYFYGSDPLRLAWRLQRGDATTRLDGEYTFVAVGGESDTTEVSYQLTVELAVPLTGFVKRRAESRIMQTALDELKAHVEAGAGS